MRNNESKGAELVKLALRPSCGSKLDYRIEKRLSVTEKKTIRDRERLHIRRIWGIMSYN